MNKKLTIGLLVVILLLAAFMRLYRISDYMTFLGDEGRDVLVVKHLLGGDLTLLGPRSSAGDFYMGPAYYYMIAPALWLANYDPVGPAIFVALLSVVTAFLIFWIGRKFFDTTAGFFGAALYAVSPLVINYSHSSWNPDVLPFFSLLLIYTVFKAVELKGSWKLYLITGFLLGIALQLHYLALFLAVLVAVYTFFGEWLMHKKIQLISLIKHYLTIFAGFLIGISPLLAFEVRHGYQNSKGIYTFIFGDTPHKAYENNATFFSQVYEVFFRLFSKGLFAFPNIDYAHFTPQLTLWAGVTIFVAIASLVALCFVKDRFIKLLFSLWLIIGIGLFGLYKKEILDYYLMIVLPLPFLLVGNLLSKIALINQTKKKKALLWSIISIACFAAIFILNLINTPLKNEPNGQKNQMKTISEFVLSKTDNKPFNFALITPGNSDHAYRYYFEVLGHSPVTMENLMNDPNRKTVTNQLLIVCEDVGCKPLGNPLFEVAGFGRATISGEWNVSVVKVYRLTHYQANDK